MSIVKIQAEAVKMAIESYDQGVADAFEIIVKALREIFPEVPEIADAIEKIDRPGQGG